MNYELLFRKFVAYKPDSDMSKSGTIIIVDDNKGVLTAVQILLKNYFSKVVTLSSPVTLTTVIREETPEVVLLDMNFTSGINTGNEGLFWLHEIKKVRPELPSYFFTAYADIDLAIRGIKRRSFGLCRQTLEQSETGRNIAGCRLVRTAWTKTGKQKGACQHSADLLGEKANRCSSSEC